jgi:preprotein translocase subunit SecG
MENVILVVHLILALSLIGAVLMQRSEGGMGSMGGGGGGGSAGGRAPGTVMSKFTWILAAAFIATSITLTIVAAQKSAGASVVDRLSDVPVVEEGVETPDLGESLLPPSSDEAPLVPSGN